MKRYRKICVLGNSGSGKSTLARQLAEVTNLPLIHLDKLFWRPGWIEASQEEFDSALAKVLESDRWIIDGNYKKTLKLRLEKTDLVIMFDYSPLFCLWRAIRRSWKEKVRPDMAEGCRERFDFSFYWYILNYNRRVRPQMVEMLQNNHGNFDICFIKSERDLYRLLESFK